MEEDNDAQTNCSVHQAKGVKRGDEQNNGCQIQVWL